MSGGSWDYLYRRVEEAAERLSEDDFNRWRKEFGEHLLKIAKALHDIEWVDSGDMSPGSENNAILECLTDS